MYITSLSTFMVLIYCLPDSDIFFTGIQSGLMMREFVVEMSIMNYISLKIIILVSYCLF